MSNNTVQRTGRLRKSLSALIFIPLLLCADVFTNTCNAETGYAARGAGHLIPNSLVLITSGSAVLLVEKSTQKLFLYDDEYNMVKTYRVTTGQKHGDKEREGDLKTPVGAYFFTRVIDGKDLHPRYGIAAVTTDYPNPIDRIRKKTGSGIWLHGTDDPARIGKPYDSRGCVVMTNEDLLDLSNEVTILETPMVIVEKVGVETEQEVANKRAAVLDFLLNILKDGASIDPGTVTIFKHNEWLVASFPSKSAQTRNVYIEEDNGTFRVVAEKTRQNGAKGTSALERH